MDILHWHVFTRSELMGLAERSPETLVDIVLALQERVLRLEEQNRQQQALIEQLSARIQHLEAQGRQDSHNSHQPPSSDGYSKPAPKSLRESSGRPAGGQKGHPGHTLKAVSHPDYTLVHRLERCPRGHSLKCQAVLRHEKRQVFNLPIQSVEVVEHRAEVKYCPACHESAVASFPSDVEAPVQYGARCLALWVYWRDVQLIPLQRIRQMTQDLFNHSVSKATIESAVAWAAQQLHPFRDALSIPLLRAPQLHSDETGLRVQGKMHWLHVLATPNLTWYGVHPKRGCDAMDDFALLPRYTGRLVHDEFSPYWRYGRSHVLCNAHHLRDLVFCAEQEHQSWARRLKALLERAQNDRLQRRLTPRRALRYRQRYRLILAGADPPQKTKAHSLRRRLIKFEPFTLAFLDNPQVPFTNNQAEQDLRMMKVQQKISGSFRTFDGARLFAALRSYIATLRKQDLSVWHGLTQLLQAKPFLPSPV